LFELQYSFEDIKAHVAGDLAYATLRYRIHLKMTEREATGEGLATVILVKQDAGWKIQHIQHPTFLNKNISRGKYNEMPELSTDG